MLIKAIAGVVKKLPSLIGVGFLFIAFMITPMFLFADDELAKATHVDLEGKPLLSAPNAILSREGEAPMIWTVTTPNIQIHRTSAQPSRGTILLFPGGGYQILAIEREGLAVADLLNKYGFDAVILEYSIGEESTARAQALADALKAVKLLQKKGHELGLNTSSLGVMGFSAGGHLAARLVHELGSSNSLADIILIYPAYLDAPGGIVPEVTPPSGIHSKVFVLIGAKDKPEWVASAAAYAKAAKRNDQQAEYHLLPDTGHGFGIQPEQKPPISDWPALLNAFLNKQ